MRRALSTTVLLASLWSAAAQAADLPGDVQAYVDRREACNYWPGETAPRHSHRAEEIEHHVRNLHCDTLDHDEAVLRARYRDEAALLDAMDQAHDALPAY